MMYTTKIITPAIITFLATLAIDLPACTATILIVFPNFLEESFKKFNL